MSEEIPVRVRRVTPGRVAIRIGSILDGLQFECRAAGAVLESAAREKGWREQLLASAREDMP